MVRRGDLVSGVTAVICHDFIHNFLSLEMAKAEQLLTAAPCNPAIISTVWPYMTSAVRMAGTFFTPIFIARAIACVISPEEITWQRGKVGHGWP